MNALDSEDLLRLLESLSVLPDVVHIEVTVRGGVVASAVVQFDEMRGSAR
jgi:hypothetical protein